VFLVAAEKRRRIEVGNQFAEEHWAKFST
jgi:hypothetical protein